MSKKLIKCKCCKKRKPYGAKGMCYKCYKKQWKPIKVICKSCGRLRPHQAKGLCGGCHMRIHHYHLIYKYKAKKFYNLELKTMKEIAKACVCCNFDKIVSIHHLDGNKDNNNIKNLVGLCPNCHKLIHSYKYFKEIINILKEKGYSTEKIHPSNYVKK